MKTIVVTAGGTIEPIDGVRGITNFSRGRLGHQIVQRLSYDHKVYYIRSKTAPAPIGNTDNIFDVTVTDTASVWNAIQSIHDLGVQVDVFIHSMAISDYTVDKIVDLESMVRQITSLASRGDLNSFTAADVLFDPETIAASGKVSSTLQHPVLYLKPTQKILPKIKTLWPNTTLIGFKLLNGVSKEELINVAVTAMEKVNGDYVVANDLTQINGEQHTAYILKRGDSDMPLYTAFTKSFIVDCIEEIANQ